VTGTIGASIRLYYEDGHASPAIRPGRRIGVPAGSAAFEDNPSPSRAYAERHLDVRHWTEMPRGGHFAAWEEPELFAEDRQAFFRPLRSA
jgi:microsomal epoxide hydrolase